MTTITATGITLDIDGDEYYQALADLARCNYLVTEGQPELLLFAIAAEEQVDNAHNSDTGAARTG